MKKILFWLIIMLPVIGSSQSPKPLIPIQGKWDNVGNPGFTPGTVAYTSLAISHDGVPYMAFTDEFNGHTLRVMKYNGSWVNVGQGIISGGMADYINLAFDPSGVPWVVFSDWMVNKKVTIMKFDGNAWITVGSPGISYSEGLWNNIAFDAAGKPYVVYIDNDLWVLHAQTFDGTNWVDVGQGGLGLESLYPSLAVSPSGEPYVVYQDYNSMGSATVKKFDGTNWVIVGQAGFSHTVVYGTSIVFSPAGEPYVAYAKDFMYGGNANVMKYNGTNWVTVGSKDFSPGSISGPTLGFGTDSKLYIAFNDNPMGTKATVMAYDSTGWNFVGEEGFSAGQTQYTNIAISQQGVVYVGYKDMGNGSKATVMRFSESDWIYMGIPGFSRGESETNSVAFSPSGEPYVAYDDFTTNWKPVVKKFDGTNWLDVGNPDGIANIYLSGNVHLVFSPSGEPYVAFSNFTIGAPPVLKFDGTNWNPVGNIDFTGGLYSGSSLAFGPEGDPYLAFPDNDNNNGMMRVIRFDGVNWVNVGQSGFSGLHSVSPSLAFSPAGEPYVAFNDMSHPFKANVMKYDGTNWNYVGTPGFTVGEASYLTLLFTPSGRPCIAFVDGGYSFKASFMEFNGTSWEYVGSPGFTQAMISEVSAKINPCGHPYIAFQYEYSPWKASVMKFDGADWVNVGTDEFTPDQASNESIAFSPSGQPCVAFTDYSELLKASVMYYPENASAGCHADFVAYNDSTVSWLTYQFLDQSYGNIVSWSWNFGDGQTSHERNPIHTYDTNGIYTVCLTIIGTDSLCYDTWCNKIVVGGVGCSAIFAHYPDSLHKNAVQFIDHSVYGVNQWHWDFGDGTTSNDQNPLHIFPHGGYYEVCLTIQTAPQYACSATTCKDVFVWNAAQCISYFTYKIHGMDVGFEGFSADTTATTFTWDFGDNGTGSGRLIQHQYANSGTYKVRLTTVDSTGCTFDTVQPVTVIDSSQFRQVYGQIFDGEFPITIGTVSIFSVDTIPPYNPWIMTNTIDSNGIYYFTLVPEGDYYIYAIPDENSGYLPTYWGNVLYWEDATIVHLGEPDNPYNIHLITSQQYNGGNGLINGTISGNSLKIANTNMMDKIMMLLMNSEGRKISFHRVSGVGNFQFPSLAYGTYYLKPEIPGITSDSIKVVISPENPTANIVLTFTGNRIIGIHDIDMAVYIGPIYPNPVTNDANINLQVRSTTGLTITLKDVAGREFLRVSKSLNPGKSRLRFRMVDLPAGFYLLRINGDDGTNIIRKFIKN